MKQIIFTLCMMTFSGSAFAISNQKLGTYCLETGKQKVVAQAKSWGCRVNIDEIEVLELDNRFYNPSKYIWYQAAAECDGRDHIVSIVQYFRGQCL